MYRSNNDIKHYPSVSSFFRFKKSTINHKWRITTEIQDPAQLFMTELACNTWHQPFLKVNFLKRKIAIWFWLLLVLYRVIALNFSGSLQYASTSDTQLLSLTPWRNSHGFNSAKVLLQQPVQALSWSCNQESWPPVFKTANCSVCGGTHWQPLEREEKNALIIVHIPLSFSHSH